MFRFRASFSCFVTTSFTSLSVALLDYNTTCNLKRYNYKYPYCLLRSISKYKAMQFRLQVQAVTCGAEL